MLDFFWQNDLPLKHPLTRSLPLSAPLLLLPLLRNGGQGCVHRRIALRCPGCCSWCLSGQQFTFGNTWKQRHTHTHTCLQVQRLFVKEQDCSQASMLNCILFAKWRKIDEHLHVVNIPGNFLGFSTCKEESFAPPPLVAIYLLLAFHEAAGSRSPLWCVL